MHSLSCDSYLRLRRVERVVQVAKVTQDAIRDQQNGKRDLDNSQATALNTILQSRGWRMIARFRQLAARWAPAGSRRERLLRGILRKIL